LLCCWVSSRAGRKEGKAKSTDAQQEARGWLSRGEKERWRVNEAVDSENSEWKKEEKDRGSEGSKKNPPSHLLPCGGAFQIA
jgi:hypothetical protein